MGNNVNISQQDGTSTAIVDDSGGGYDYTGTLRTKQYRCPQCGKMVDKLLKNGYCSQKCAVSARAEKAQASVSAAGEKTLAIIDEVKKKLEILDMALNIL